METQQKKNPVKIAIVLLAVLLGISILALAGLLFYNYFADGKPASASVPGNVIATSARADSGYAAAIAQNVTMRTAAVRTAAMQGATMRTAAAQKSPQTAMASENAKAKAQMLQLYKNHPEDTVPFAADNLFPGDTITQYYGVKTSHKEDVTLLFRPDVTEETGDLGNVLHIKVTNMETGDVLCDGMFAEVDGKEVSQTLAANDGGESISYYEITVSLDTSAGNGYQAARLLADFHWYAAEEEDLIRPPQTGDNFMILLWVVIAVSASLLILLVLYKRGKEGGNRVR